MGWDDSDDDEWDDVDVDAKLAEQAKEKERQRRKEEGYDTESEEEAEAKPEPVAAKPKPKPKPKAAPKEDEPQLTAQQRKILQRQAEEEQDAARNRDLFSGFEKEPSPEELKKAKEKAEAEERKVKEAAAKPKVLVIDAFEYLHLAVQGDVEKMSNRCIEKVDKTKVKSGTQFFLSNMVKALESHLTSAEIGDVEKIMAEVVKEKKFEKANTVKDNKATTKLSKTTKFNTANEWEEVYGGGADDEDWTQEEWDDWYKAEAKAKK